MSLSISIKEKQVLIDGLTINYKIIGNGEIPIILLHGWSVDSDKYIETANQLAISDPMSVIFIPDLPGFGKSDDPLEAWIVDDYVNSVKKFADSLKLEKFVLIGHSFGGRIAIKFSVKYPEKLRVLVLTGAAGVKHPLTFKQKIFYIAAKMGRVLFSLPLINKLERSAQRLLYRAAQEKDYYEAQGVIRETFKKVIDEDLTDYLEKIETPALLVWGANDRSTPLKDAYLMKNKIPKSCLKIIDEANHSLPYQIPEKFAKITAEFIKKMDEPL